VAPRAGRGLHRRSGKFLEGVAEELVQHCEKSAASRNYRGAPPFVLDYVWGWFCELSGARTSNGFGLNPISFTEILAWAQLAGVAPTPWEVRLLKRLDAATLAVKASNQPVEGEPEVEADVEDMEAVMAVFSSLKSRARAAFG
jgi:hypothetical protein